MNSKPFTGTNVFMSRNLVPPEVFDSLHDALKLNGADVFLCCDPSRNSPNDFHVISSSDHEKFEGLRAKGCNLVGPQCVLACAKERRELPKEGYTCCLAMDGVKVLISGFEMEERAKFGKLVAAMGGSLLTRATSDVSFVVVKNVIAGKYKWAVHVKKPVVTINWLYQCWNEHRIVPQESYRVPAFSGLIICVTGIPGDERKEMEKLIVQNGGRYSAMLTRACTHLICDAAEGDKYKVAKKWGHIRIVTHKWFDQSIAKRTCLVEESYSVQPPVASDSNFFPQDRRDEVVEWISEGGGMVVDDHLKKNVDFTVECHGFPPQSSSSQTTHVSSHWVRSCLEDGTLLDVAGHMLYSPLPCRTPLPGFERYRFCVSQYEEKERLLLRNLCFVLGAKFGGRLTKRVTHLVCKFSSGPKYEACPKWGIEPVTCDWIYECIRKDGIVALDLFRPKEPSDRDHKAGLCTLSQFPTQAVRMLSGDNSSQLSTQSLDVRKPVTRSANMMASSSRKEAEITVQPSKKARLFKTVCSEDDRELLSRSDKLMAPSVISTGVNMQQHAKVNSQAVPDVAAAIEDLLEQTTKIHDMSTPGETTGIKQILSSDQTALVTDPADSHTAFGPSTHWLSRFCFVTYESFASECSCAPFKPLVPCLPSALKGGNSSTTSFPLLLTPGIGDNPDGLLPLSTTFSEDSSPTGASRVKSVT